MLRKFWIMFALAFLFSGFSGAAFAEVQEISAEGEYRLGDRDTREAAKIAALADARRKIVEQVGVFVESYSEVNNFVLTSDQIKTAANSLIKIKHEEVHFYENGTLCRAFVVASIDKNDIPKILIDPTLKEYNGHYYKIFDEGLTWADAKKRCEDMGGHLVTITSKGEQAVVQNLIFSDGTKNYYWTGGFRIENDNWAWITGEKFSYSNWAGGEPNNGVGNENIITLYTSGLWNDCPAAGISDNPNLAFFNAKNSGFICEWDSLENVKEAY